MLCCLLSCWRNQEHKCPTLNSVRLCDWWIAATKTWKQKRRDKQGNPTWAPGGAAPRTVTGSHESHGHRQGMPAAHSQRCRCLRGWGSRGRRLVTHSVCVCPCPCVSVPVCVSGTHREPCRRGSPAIALFQRHRSPALPSPPESPAAQPAAPPGSGAVPHARFSSLRCPWARFNPWSAVLQGFTAWGQHQPKEWLQHRSAKRAANGTAPLYLRGPKEGGTESVQTLFCIFSSLAPPYGRE